MKKEDLKKLALLGIAGGVLLSANGLVAEEQEVPVAANYGASNGCGAPSGPSGGPSGGPAKQGQGTLLTEDQLLLQLSSEGKKIYMSLSPEGKALAIKMASYSCKGQNDCKGQGSCKTEENACGGQNGCKGKSPGPFRDKNAAVRAAAKLMAEKRGQATGK